MEKMPLEELLAYFKEMREAVKDSSRMECIDARSVYFKWIIEYLEDYQKSLLD